MSGFQTGQPVGGAQRENIRQKERMIRAIHILVPSLPGWLCISGHRTLSRILVTALSPFPFRVWSILVTIPDVLQGPFLVIINPAHAFVNRPALNSLQLLSWRVPLLLARTLTVTPALHCKQMNHTKMNACIVGSQQIFINYLQSHEALC